MNKIVSTNAVVAEAMKAKSVQNAGNGVTIYGIMDQYRDRVRGEIQELIQKVGDTQNAIFQESEKAKNLAQKWVGQKLHDKILIKHRQIDALLDNVANQLRKIYNNSI